MNTQRIETLEGKVSQQGKLLEETVSKEVSKCLNDSVEDQVKKLFEDERDRTQRVKNVLMTNVPECSETDSKHRKEYDINKVMYIIINLLGIDISADKIKNIIRLGPSPKGTDDKGRLMKVMFETEEIALKVLKSAKALNESDNDGDRSIRIFRDLNKKDRELRTKLVKEMIQKNEDLVKDGITDFRWKIRGEELIKVRSNPAGQRVGGNF